jgi:tetratricopeptide (TPR) repeat protein
VRGAGGLLVVAPAVTLPLRITLVASEIIDANLDRFTGEERASLLNQRAGLYTVKGEHAAALPDYREAYALDPNLTNLTNLVEALAKLGMTTEAKPLAEQALRNPNLGKDERKMLSTVLAA